MKKIKSSGTAVSRAFRKALSLTLILAVLMGAITAVAAAMPMESKNGITEIKQLDGKNIGVQTGVLYEDAIKDDIDGETWLYYKMPNDMIPALEAGRIDAYLIEEVGFVAQRYEHPELMRLEEKAGVMEFAVIVGNNDKQSTLYPQIQEFIRDGLESGWLDQLYDYWVRNWDPNTCHIEKVPEFTGENGTVSIAIEGGYEPFSFEAGGYYSGYDVEFMMNFCAKYGYTPDFQAMEFDSIGPGALSGRYDFGMNIVVEEERAEAAVLSDPYYSCDIVFVVEGEYEGDMGFFERMGYNFNKTFIRDDRWKLFAEGMGRTMLITVASVVFGTILGFAAYLACRERDSRSDRLARRGHPDRSVPDAAVLRGVREHPAQRHRDLHHRLLADLRLRHVRHAQGRLRRDPQRAVRGLHGARLLR